MSTVNVHLHTPALTHRTHTATPVSETSATAGGGSPLLWLGAAAVLFFLVPFVGTGRLELQPDLYYLGYFTVAVVFFAAFLARHGAALRPLWTVHLWQSLLIGALAGIALAIGIFNQAATPHPDGWRFGFQIIWRGLIYGSVDALTLYVFPAAVAYLLLHGNRNGLRRKAAFAGLAVLLSLLVTTTYHLGYSEYRGDTIKYPEIGALVANVPTALTGNPLGAVLRTTPCMFPRSCTRTKAAPSTCCRRRRLPTTPATAAATWAAGLAAGWLLAAAGALTLLVRRQPTVNDAE